MSFRPPLESFSTSFNCSRACSPLRAILPEPRLQWLGQLPLLRRTENSKFISYIKTLHRFLGKHRYKCMRGEITKVADGAKSAWDPHAYYCLLIYTFHMCSSKVG